MDTIASENLKEGKKDFAGYYQIPYQTLIDQELVYMTILLMIMHQSKTRYERCG